MRPQVSCSRINREHEPGANCSEYRPGGFHAHQAFISAPNEAGTTDKRRDTSKSRVVRVLGGTNGCEAGSIRVVGRCRGCKHASKLEKYEVYADKSSQVRQPQFRFHQHLIVLEQSLSALTWVSASQGPRSGMHGIHSLLSPSLLAYWYDGICLDCFECV